MTLRPALMTVLLLTLAACSSSDDESENPQPSLSSAIIATVTRDTTPPLSFHASADGSLRFFGHCDSEIRTASQGSNNIDLKPPEGTAFANGTVDDCAVRLVDANDNSSDNLEIPAFTVDTIPPSLSGASIVSPNANRTPPLTFDSTEAGLIIYSGNCDSPTKTALAGSNTVALTPPGATEFDDGTVANCFLTVTDTAGNESATLVVPTFVVYTPDAAGPQLSAASIKSPTADSTPDFSFESNEAGVIYPYGKCVFEETRATPGSNTLTLHPFDAPQFSDGTYDNCGIVVTDIDGNQSPPFPIPPFIIYTPDDIAPVLSAATIQSPTADSTPPLTFTSTDAGNISFKVKGACRSKTTVAVVGTNTLLLQTAQGTGFENGTYSGCTLTVTDYSNNESSPLSIPSFVVSDVKAPVLSAASIQTPTADRTPAFSFTSTEDGSLALSGSCRSDDTQATAGNNTITLKPSSGSEFADGTYSDCALTVTDAADNVSSALEIPTFRIVSDATAPVLQAPQLQTPTQDTTPTFTFVSSEAGTIGYTGGCTSASRQAQNGSNSVVLNPSGGGTFAVGSHSGCALVVTDSTGNASHPLQIGTFVITSGAPCLADTVNVGLLNSDTQCDTFKDAINARVHTLRTPGFAQFAYLAEQAQGAVTADNSRLVIVDDFHPANTCTEPFSNSCYHGNRVRFVAEQRYGVPVSRICNTQQGGAGSTLMIVVRSTINNCNIPQYSIVNISLSNLLQGTTNSFDADYFLDKKLFAVLPTGNAGLAQPEQGDTEEFDDFLEGYAGIFVTGHHVFTLVPSGSTPEQSVPIPYNFRERGSSCGDYWKYCIAAQYTHAAAASGHVYSGTSFSAPTVATSLAMLLHRWPALWPENDTPELLVNLVLGCASYDGLAGSTEELRQHYGRGVLSFKCLFQPSGALYADPPDLSAALATQDTGNEHASDAVAAPSQTQAQPGPLPVPNGALYLEGAARTSALVGYDRYGRDFNVAPQVVRPSSCRHPIEYHGTLSWKTCEHTLRWSYAVMPSLRLGTFFTHNGFGDSYGANNMAMGDSLGMTLDASHHRYLGRQVSLQLRTQFMWARMVSTAHASLLRELAGYRLQLDAGLHYRAIRVGVRHDAGLRGRLAVGSQVLRIHPDRETAVQFSFQTRL